MFQRLGALLDRRRIRDICAMLLAAEIAISAYFIAASYNLFHNQPDPVTTDFVSFYAAGSLVDAGTPNLVYHPPEHFLAEQRASEPGIKYNYFYYPPPFLIVCAMLGYLPYVPAFLLFEASTLVLYLAAAIRILRRPVREALVPLAAFPIVFWNVGFGQNGFLTAGLFGAATLLVERRPATAGLLFGSICYKPHLGLLVPVALLAGRHWRAFAAAAVAVIGWTLASLALFGMATWRDFLASIADSRAVYQTGFVKLSAFVTPFGAVLQPGGPAWLAYAAQIAAAGAAAAFVAWVWRRRLSLEVRAAALASTTVVAVPVVNFYDLLLTAIAAAWLCRAGQTVSGGEKALFAVSYLLLLNPVQLAEQTRIPIGFLVAAALVATVARRALAEARQATA
jgi:alpha-1,2-mannosyltransferase